MKYKIDFMKAKTLAFPGDSLERINFERVVSMGRNRIRELLSESIELFSFFLEMQPSGKDFMWF